MIASDIRPSLVGMSIFRAAADVRHLISLDVAGERHPVSPVSSGFVAIQPGGFKEHMTIALGALGWGRPVAFLEDTCGLAEFAASATESEFLPAADGAAQPVAFAVPTLFRSRRAAAIERRLERCLRYRDVARKKAAQSPCLQVVHAVGVGPWTLGAGPQALRSLESVPDVVMTDWTHSNTFTRIPGHERFIAHILQYRYGDFDRNIDQVDEALCRLSAAGRDQVGLLVEGNPDTYDVLDGLPLTSREVRVTPGVPIGLLAASRTARHFREDPFARSFAYLSALHGRHHLPPEQFLGELTSYLSAGISCVLVEMHKGDVELAQRAIGLCGREKSAVLMSNHFSSEEETLLLQGSPHGLQGAFPADRGGLSTLLIADGGLR